MRTSVLLIVAALAVAACADDQQPAAPMRPRATGSASGDVAPSGQGIRVPQAKPQDQVGWTKITTAYSDYGHLIAGSVAALKATCPAGTTAISGGHVVTSYIAGESTPFIQRSSIDPATNSWVLIVDNEQPGASAVNMYAVAYCAS